ncbi:MAG: saccharopine dehydrogenase NADP-binding domain-containing protein [Acidimicrobiales bacterium]|nr:saccharopine dehydrogenase NADP-binding domain-containing protein [Acidimicrobiales bacterium]
MGRDYDVVLFGPTGVTGREVARYLSRRAPAVGLRWAAAGRDRARVEAALRAVGATPDGLLYADVGDAASIDALARSATVVANLVGPYAAYGEPVYEACARHGTHQVDLSGETDWVLEMIGRHGDAAVASGARLVPTCGFEALPFDLAALVAARAAHARHGRPVVDVDAAVSIRSDLRPGGVSDVVSGGTFGSLVGMIRRGPGRAVRDPHLLDPPGPGPGATTDRAGYRLRPRRHAGTGAWLAPLLPAPFLNPAVVHRSAALLRAEGDPTFAPSFRYREGTVVASMLPERAGPMAPALAAALSGTQAAIGLAARAPGVARRPIADVLERIGPKPGDGPGADTLDAWDYRIDARATTDGGGTADVVLRAVGHPGYKSTATMVGEAALILADPSAPVPDRAGFLTPATALGPDVVERFSAAGVTVTDSAPA